MTDEKKSVLYSVNGAIARLTLNRPEKRNALNETVIDDLKQGLRQADSDKTMHVVVILGAGPDFCSGADLTALRRISGASVEENVDDARSLMELFVVMRNMRLPIIDALRGRALAGRCRLATARAT